MKHDWKASRERFLAALSGETPDRVPFMLWAFESMGPRISGLTLRESITSPQKLAEISIRVYEFLRTDLVVPITLPYPGPFDAVAFAKVNGKADKILWNDYDTPLIREGKLCETEKDIEALEIPDHMKVEPWPTILESMAIIQEKTGMPQFFIPSLTWQMVQLLRGSQAYVDAVENPDLLLKLCEKIYASQWDYYKAYCKIVGKPTLAFNAQYAFNRHMLSFEDAWKYDGQFTIRFCKETGLPVFVHNCGFEPYWDEMIEKYTEEGVVVFGVNGSHPLDLDEWVRFRHKYPNIFILGASIFVNAEIEHGTPEDVEERVRQNIIKLAPYKRFMINPVCSLGWRMPLDNVFAVRDAVEKYGKYPIKV
jgi:uroporphyrinogen-III decarboxylase